MSATKTKKSVVVKKFGGYDSISVQEYPLQPLDDKIEVEVHFCGMNFSDLYSRQGLFPKECPFVLGSECCGIITAMGCESDVFKVGQRVICYNYKGGMYSNIIRVAPENCYVIPEHVTYKEGASIFVNYLTAYFSVCVIGNLRPNESILIKSCGGGVGWAATQLAKNIEGVSVYGTASEGKEDLLKENGVAHIFNYKDLYAQLKTQCPDGFDLIIENHSGSAFDQSLSMLKPLGRIVSIGANNLIEGQNKISKFLLMTSWFRNKSVPMTSLIMKNNVAAGLHLGVLAETEPKKIEAALEHIFKLLDAGKIKPRIDSVYPIDQIVDATKLLTERKNVGKVLISMEE